MHFAHDGAFIAQQLVEEGGFADIGFADDCHRNAVADGLAGAEGVGQVNDFGVDLTGGVEQFGAVGKLDILFAEVQFEFEQRGQPEQLVVETVELLADAALHLTERQAMGGGILRRDEVGDSFGLTEVHAAVGKGTSREFAPFGHPYATLPDEQMEQLLLDVEGAVARDFDHVFARVAMGSAEKRDNHLVELFARRGVDNPAKGEGVCLSVVEAMVGLVGAEDTGTSRNRIRATDANDGYSAHARRGGKGADSHNSSNSMISPSVGS